MTTGQTEIDFGDAARLEAHLARCGVTPVAAGLAALVLRLGKRRPVDGEDLWVLTISSRQAAAALACNDRSVRDAAAGLARREWFRVLPGERRLPPTYVLDRAAAASLPTTADRLEEALAGGGVGLAGVPGVAGCGVVRASEGWCGVVRGGDRVIEPANSQNPCSHPPRVHTVSPAGSAPPRTAPHRPAVAVLPPRDPLAIQFPWARSGGVTDAELVAAVRGDRVEVLRHLYDHAVSLKWAAASPDAWLRFLTGCHHAATARLRTRMGRLVVFVKQGCDVTRTTQASEQWAARQIRNGHRDPSLVAMGRSMAPEEEDVF